MQGTDWGVVGSLNAWGQLIRSKKSNFQQFFFPANWNFIPLKGIMSAAGTLVPGGGAAAQIRDPQIWGPHVFMNTKDKRIVIVLFGKF